MLDKKGNSNSGERAQLFNQFIECCGDRDVACLTADREFVGKDWLGYLLEEPQTPFRIRIRENHKLRKEAVSLRGKTLFANLKVE
jgi:hypothetical protein